MKKALKNWYQELQEVDTLANHKQTVNLLEEVYLETTAANNRKERIRIMWLLRCLKKIL